MCYTVGNGRRGGNRHLALSSCRFCDEIAVFDHGRVVQQGVHDNLVEAGGKYQALWEAQAQYYQKKEG